MFLVIFKMFFSCFDSFLKFWFLLSILKFFVLGYMEVNILWILFVYFVFKIGIIRGKREEKNIYLIFINFILYVMEC